MTADRKSFIESALRDPSKVFDDPMCVVGSGELSTRVKREILLQWELDARELLVAEDENMAGGEPAMLQRVHEALRQLGADPVDPEALPGNQEGGRTNRQTVNSPEDLNVADLMTPNPRFVHLENTLHDAAVLMRDLDIGVLFVVDGDVLRGVVTDRDIAVRGSGNGLEPNTSTIESVMTPDVVHVRADANVDVALEAMLNERVRRLAITDHQGHLRGILSLADILTAFPDYLPALLVIAQISQPFAGAKEPILPQRRKDVEGAPGEPGAYTSLPHVPRTNRPA